MCTRNSRLLHPLRHVIEVRVIKDFKQLKSWVHEMGTRALKNTRKTNNRVSLRLFYGEHLINLLLNFFFYCIVFFSILFNRLCRNPT